jgi:hypothetical protein
MDTQVAEITQFILGRTLRVSSKNLVIEELIRASDRSVKEWEKERLLACRSGRVTALDDRHVTEYNPSSPRREHRRLRLIFSQM